MKENPLDYCLGKSTLGRRVFFAENDVGNVSFLMKIIENDDVFLKENALDQIPLLELSEPIFIRTFSKPTRKSKVRVKELLEVTCLSISSSCSILELFE